MKKHYEAVKIFECHGIRAHSQLLALLGYKVKWSGLDPENAEIFNQADEFERLTQNMTD
jgi:hypothetical protein